MLDLELRFSPTLATLLGLAHLVSLILLWITPLGVFPQFGIGLLVVASWLFHLRRDCFRLAPGAIVRLRVEHGGKFSYQTRAGEWHDAALLGNSLVTPWLSVLGFRREGARFGRYTVLFPDTLDAEAYRKLRVLVKWTHPAGTV